MLLPYRAFPLFPLFFLAVVFLMGREGKAAEIEARLSFSVDGGKTFSAETPVLPPGRDLQVRADWEIHGETRPIAQGLIFLSVRNETEDFASANQGWQVWRGKPAWFQQDDSHLHVANQDRTAILDMQFGSRPQGTMGYSNSWDKTLGKAVSVPLPAAAPLSAGTHSFIASIYYRETGDAATGEAAIVRKEIPFEVKIDSTAVVETPVMQEGKAAEIEARLSFSVDGGKTFSAAMPVLPPGHDIQVRAEWEIHGETRPIAQNLIFLSVRNETEDFASANQGRQDWRGKPAWFQQDDSHLHVANQDRTAILTMQFGSRPEGTMGYSNSWNKTLEKAVSVPLPAAVPLTAGIHSFIAGVYYREVVDSATGDAGIVRKEVPFEVKIDSTAGENTPMGQ